VNSGVLIADVSGAQATVTSDRRDAGSNPARARPVAQLEEQLTYTVTDSDLGHVRDRRKGV